MKRVNNTVDIKGKNVKLGKVHVTNEPEVKINGKRQEKVKVSGTYKVITLNDFNLTVNFFRIEEMNSSNGTMSM